MTTERDGRAALIAAIDRTMCGSAQVTVRARHESGDEQIDGELRGVVDFESDRCALAGTEATVLAGSATYQALPDGRWTVQQGPPGTRGVFHPRGALEVLRDGCVSAEAVGPKRISAVLDRERLDALVHPGVAPAWTVTADVELDDDGRVVCAVLIFTAETEEGAGFGLAFDYGDFGDGSAIDLPPDAATISLEDHIADQFGS